MDRRNVALVALVGALAGCGSARDPTAAQRLTRDEVRALTSTHSAVGAYCSVSARLESIDTGDAKATVRAGTRLNEQYGVASAALRRYEGVLRAHPDARPPGGDPSVDATPRRDAQRLLDDELTDCRTSTAQAAAKRWRTRLHAVLAGLPPARSG